MAHYEYKGQHFELPDTYTPEQAKIKIQTHLGETKKPVEDLKAPTWMGVPEAALSMVAGLPAQVGGGLYGLSTLLSGQGLEKAAKNSQEFQEKNFGFGQYKGTTEPGKRAVEKAGELFAKPGELAGEYIGAPVGKALGVEDAGRFAAQLSTDIAMNFLPLHLGVTMPAKGVVKGAEALGNRAKAKQTKANAGSIIDDFVAKQTKPEEINTGAKAGEYPAPVDQAYLAQRRAEDNARALAEKQSAIDEQIALRQADLERGVRDNIKRAEVEQILTRLEQERTANQAAFESAEQARMVNEAAAKEREMLSTGENVPGGRVINRKPVVDSGVMGLPLEEAAPPIGLSTGEGMPSVADPRRAQEPSNLMGVPYETPTGLSTGEGLAANADPKRQALPSNVMGEPVPPPVGLSTGEGVPGGRVVQRAPVVESGIMGQPTPAPFDPWGSVGGKQRQRGGLDIEAIGEALKGLRARFGGEDTIDTPRSPEMLAAKQERTKKAGVVEDVLGEKLPQYTNPRTYEEAAFLAEGAKDISPSAVARGARQAAPGINNLAAITNNPVLKYIRGQIYEAKAQANTFSKQYVTGKGGLSEATVRLSAADKEVVGALQTRMDKEQIPLTPEFKEHLRERGVSDNVINYLEVFNKATDNLWDWNQRTKDAQGVSIAPKRDGYAPSIHSGDYMTFVTDAEGKPLGYVSAKSIGEWKKAVDWVKANHPDANILSENVKDARVRNAKNLSQASKYRDMHAILKMVQDANGDMSKLNNQMAMDALRPAVDLFGHNVHNMAKKGLWGNDGNKPWLSASENAKARLEANVRFLEDAAEYQSLQKVVEEAKLIQQDPRFEKLPNTKDYIDQYMSNVAGQYTNAAGKIANEAFDALHKNAVETLFGNIPGVNNYIAPSKTLNALNWTKNKISQHYMGWFNGGFLGTQLMQPLQTAVPLLQSVAKDLGVSPLDISTSSAYGIQLNTRFALKDLNVLKDNFNPKEKAMLDYAETHGITTFSELEKAYEGTKTKAGRAYDKTAEFTMQLGEKATRPAVFFAFTDMLSKVEPNLNKAMETAEMLTNRAMGDYHKYERPLMYSGLGMMAGHAGGLTTFKHTMVGDLALHGQKALGKAPGQQQVAPLAASLAATFLLAGITGIVGYNAFNTIYEELREVATKERRSIEQDALKALPQWSRTGVLSDFLDYNVQSRFSAADIIPDSLGEAAFPYLSGAGDMAAAGYKFAKDPNVTTGGNLAHALVPNSAKQAVNSAMRREDNWLLNKEGKKDVQRTPEQWKFSAITGLVPTEEAINRNRLAQNKENEMAGAERRKSISQKWATAIANNSNDKVLSEILNEYEQAGGDASQLLRGIGRTIQQNEMSSQERAQGTPKTLSGVKKYERFQQ